MNFLLDTHALIWALFAPGNLGRKAAGAIRDRANGVNVSAVSFWEISLKFNLGKLHLSGISPGELPEAAIETGFDVISLEPVEAAAFHRLPRERHADPFDRLIAWQAISRDLVLVTRDPALVETCRPHGLKTLW